MSSLSTSTKPSQFFSLLLKSVQGGEQDYTTGSLRKAVVMLSVPMILEMGMESVFALVDLFFVSKLGQHAISTVGLTESVLTLVYSLAIGTSMAATALVARRIGEKNPDGAARAAVQAIWVAIGLIVLVSISGLIWAGDLLRLMGAEAQTVAIGVPYVRIMMGSSVFIMLLFLINGIFRGAGDASVAMKSLWIANLCNIALCPLLINGWGPVPAMGLTGAAVATAIGRGIGVAYQLYHLFNGRHQVKLTLASLGIDWSGIRSVVVIAWPATLQFVIGSCSWIFLARLVAQTGGSEASAGYQTAIRILLFFLLPAWGIANAAATLVGQNLGAGNPARAEKAVMLTAKYNALFMVSVSLLFLVAARPVVALFTSQPEVSRVAVLALRIMSSGYLFYGVGMVLTNAFNGAGDTRTPTWINVFGFWVLQIPLAYILAKATNLHLTGIFIAIPIAEFAITAAALYYFKKGRWKTVEV